MNVLGSRPRTKTAAELELMHRAGQVVARTLATLRAAVAPGVSTADLDAIAAESIAAQGATPSFLGYHGYPATICTSVNDHIVHGIPSDTQRLRTGDLVSIDCGAVLDGWHGDAAITVAVGEVPAAHRALIDACENALSAAIAAARVGARLRDIGQAVESVARRHGYGLVEEYGGHGIGTAMHELPAVPNYVGSWPGHGLRLRPGLVLALEPMITLGGGETRELADGWTVVTADGSLAAHVEHTVAVTERGPWVLTAGSDLGHDGAGASPAAQSPGRVPGPD